MRFTSIKCCFLFVFCLFHSYMIAQEEWIIIANGPSLSKMQLQHVILGRKVVALDGAANVLRKLEILPYAILGDFDSIEGTEYWGIKKAFNEIDEQSMPYLGHFGVWIIPEKDQNYTDLEKGIRYCDQQAAQTIFILNAIGGRMDHTLANIGLLRKCYRTDRFLNILTDKERIEYIKDGSTVIRGRIGDQCAILGYPEAVMTSVGLTYNGEGYPLKLGIQESVCNTLAQPEAQIRIEGEALIIHPYYYDEN